MAETITADMIIHDIVTRHPETVKVFHGHGLPCTACAVGSRESVAGGARSPSFDPQKNQPIIKHLQSPAHSPRTANDTPRIPSRPPPDFPLLLVNNSTIC